MRARISPVLGRSNFLKVKAPVMTLSTISRGRRRRTALLCVEWLEDRSLLSLTGLLPAPFSLAPPNSSFSQPALGRSLPIEAFSVPRDAGAGRGLLADVRSPGGALSNLVNLAGAANQGVAGINGLFNLTTDLTTSLGQVAQNLPSAITANLAHVVQSLGGAISPEGVTLSLGSVALSAGDTELSLLVGAQVGQGVGVTIGAGVGDGTGNVAASLAIGSSGTLPIPGTGKGDVRLNVDASSSGSTGALLNTGTPTQVNAATNLLAIGAEAGDAPPIREASPEVGDPLGDGMWNPDQRLPTHPTENQVLIGAPDVPRNYPLRLASWDYSPARIYPLADQLGMPGEEGSLDPALSPGQAAESLNIGTGEFEAAWSHFLGQLKEMGASGSFWHSILSVSPWLVGLLIIGAAFEIGRRRHQQTLRGLALRGVCGVSLGNCFPDMGGLSLPE
jgi:hypothetical protein